jgi:hypothetical protein
VASLTFAGLVLERHAVGVTVTYPGVTVTTAGGDGAPALAHVVLPTYNCLGVEAPADPVAAGCVRSTTEYADLPTPGLTVLREDDGLRITGTFPTYTRPNGTPPAWTGRAYALTVTVQPLGERPDADAPAGAPVPAAAVVHLGTDRAESIGAAGLSVLRYRR